MIIKEIFEDLNNNIPYYILRETSYYLKEAYYGNTLSRYLISAYMIYKQKSLNQILTTELSEGLNLKPNTIRRIIKGFIEEGYFKILRDSKGGQPKKYCLTVKGIKKAIKIFKFLEIIKKKRGLMMYWASFFVNCFSDNGF